MNKENIVGNNLRKLRMNEKLTQEELALRCGLSQGYINQLESGKRKFTQKSLELIAHAFSLPIIEFFKENNMEQNTLVAEAPVAYKKKTSYKKEFISLLNELPEHIINHYLTLMKLECQLLKNNKNNKKTPRR